LRRSIIRGPHPPHRAGDPILDDPQSVPNQPGPGPSNDPGPASPNPAGSGAAPSEPAGARSQAPGPDPAGPSASSGPKPTEPKAAPGPNPAGAKAKRPPRPKKPGLREEFRATIAAGIRIGRAHLALARAELDSILDEGKRFGSLAGVAAALVVFALILFSVGFTLFLGEWLFGSIGWGVLLGTEAAIGGAVLLIAAALYVPSDVLAGRFILSFGLGVLVAVVLGLDLFHKAFSAIGDSLLPTVDPANRPLVVGVLIGAVAGAIVGLVLSLVRWRGFKALLSLVIGLAVLGLVIGALLAIDYGLAVTIAFGLAVWLALWPAMVGRDIQLTGINVEGLKNRFYPRLTVETTKETIEWIQQQRPLGPKS
jgi:hypothetical protein